MKLRTCLSMQFFPKRCTADEKHIKCRACSVLVLCITVSSWKKNATKENTGVPFCTSPSCLALPKWEWRSIRLRTYKMREERAFVYSPLHDGFIKPWDFKYVENQCNHIAIEMRKSLKRELFEKWKVDITTGNWTSQHLTLDGEMIREFSDGLETSPWRIAPPVEQMA